MSETDLDAIASWLEVLQAHEYFSRKYRYKGDAWYDHGRSEYSMEFHALAAEEEEKARAVLKNLTGTLGDPGAVPSPDTGDLQRLLEQAGDLENPWTDGDDFDDACFYARYPRWATFLPNLVSAYERWKEDSRFLSEAPEFKPKNPLWEP